MPPIEQSDGFAKAAQTLRARAATSTELAIKDDMLKAAEKFEDIHKKAELVFGKVNQSLADAEQLRRLHKKRTQVSWLGAIGVLALVVIFWMIAKAAGM
ncbi:MAG: hypothetical protein H0W47_18095 [Polaromonas sp.]|uniref:hypothetical protein n=1 Tax=Polaromonas sp. TaxID=1869339 RepID=UPI0018160F77|nr:hypothetical protein [Polaromonas sp.]MBA3595677.1 hypothetical protein [Polaromonas sp.]